MSANPDTNKFVFCCPKCGISTHYHVGSQGAGYTPDTAAPTETRWHDKVFACLCGKRLYANAIPEEYDRQETSFYAAQTRAQQDARRARRAKLAEQRKEKEREEDAARQARIQARKDGPEPEPPTGEQQHLGVPCGFGGCENFRRENSIYCSRSCSNKNARARHAARKKGTA